MAELQIESVRTENFDNSLEEISEEESEEVSEEESEEEYEEVSEEESEEESTQTIIYEMDTTEIVQNLHGIQQIGIVIAVLIIIGIASSFVNKLFR